MDGLNPISIEFTVTLGRLTYPYLALVGTQLVFVTYAYLYGQGKQSFYDAYIAGTVVGTVLAYLALLLGPQLL